MTIDILQLKAEQDKKKKRIQDILDVFVPFRDGFFDEISEFATGAIEQGLEGVSFAMRQVSPTLIEMAIKLNYFDFAITSSQDVYPIDVNDMNTLAARILVYSNRPDEMPLFDVVVASSGVSVSCTLYQILDNREPFEILQSNSVTNHGGKLVADVVIDHIYDIRHYWNKNILLADIQTRRSTAIDLGFRKNKKL